MPLVQAGGIPTATHTVAPGAPSRARAGGLPTEQVRGRTGRGEKTRTAAAVPSTTSSGRAGQGTKTRQGTTAAERSSGLGVYTSPVITDAQFGLAEAEAERWPFTTLKVDWTRQDFTGPASDLSWCVDRITVEREITGELPAAAGVMDGFASGQMTADLSGTRPGAALTLAEELSPYRADSPLYAVKKTTAIVRAEMGLLTEDGPKAYRQLTGPVRKVAVDESEQSVTITASDPSELIRESITLPTYAEFNNHALRRAFGLTINTQWVVDYVFRKNGFYASPRPHPSSIIACTGHGGLVSEIGFNGAPIALESTSAPSAGLWTEDSHPWGMLGTPELVDSSASPPDAYQEFYGALPDQETPPVQFTTGNGFAWSSWVHIGPWMGLGASYERRLMQVRPTEGALPRLFVNWFGDGSLYAGIVLPNGAIVGTPKIAMAGTARWRHIGVHWRWTSPTAMVVTLRMDGQTRSWSLTHAAVTVADTWAQQGYRANLQVRMMLWRAWTNMNAWVAATPPTLAEWQARESHVPQADIGRGNNELTYLPDIAATDSYDVLKASAGAEFAVLGFTEAGRPFFRPRADSVSVEPTVELDVEKNLSEVRYSISSDSVRNVIGYSSQARYHDAKFQTVVKAEDILQLVIPGGRTYIYEFDWPWGAGGYQGGVLPYMGNPPNAGIGNGQWSDQVQHGWTYSYGTDWREGANPQSVVVKYVQVAARRVRVIVNNSAGTRAIRIATPATDTDAGTPALRIGGWPIVSRPAHVAEFRDAASIARYGAARAYAVPTSEWRQTPGQLDPVAKALLAAMADEIPLLEDLPVRGDPRTQPGMVARARFRGEASQPIVGTIVRVSRELGSSGLHDRISLRPLPMQTLAPAGWTFFVDTSRYQFDRSDPINLPRLKDLGYAGNIAKIGQGAGTTTGGTAYGATLDPYWATNRDTSRQLWPDTFAGYWYVGSTEAPADQAARCKAALGDTSIPIMLDWEDGGGTWTNLLNVLAAFRTAGLKVTILYCGSGYANSSAAGAPTTIDADSGLNVIRARYWTNDAGNPRALFDDITDPRAFLLGTFAGATPDAGQFTQYGTVYAGMDIDVDAFPGTPAGLANMINGR